MSKIVITKLKIEGMHCTSCAMNIDFDLEDLDGVHQAQTNYAKQETEIKYDETKIKLETLFITIEKIGYKAKLWTQ